MNLCLSPALVLIKRLSGIRRRAYCLHARVCVCVLEGFCACVYPVVLRWSATNISNYRAWFQYNKGLIAPGNKLNTLTHIHTDKTDTHTGRESERERDAYTHLHRQTHWFRSCRQHWESTLSACCGCAMVIEYEKIYHEYLNIRINTMKIWGS